MLSNLTKILNTASLVFITALALFPVLTIAAAGVIR